MLFLSQLLHFLAVLDLVDENFCGLETGNEMLIDHQCRISGNISRNFLLALFINEASETANIYVASIGHGTFHHTEKCFYRCSHIRLVYSGLFSNLVDNICFGHCLCIFIRQKFNGRANLICAARLKNEY